MELRRTTLGLLVLILVVGGAVLLPTRLEEPPPEPLPAGSPAGHGVAPVPDPPSPARDPRDPEPSGGGSLKVIVRDAAGLPLEGIRVDLDGGGFRARGATGADGRTVFSELRGPAKGLRISIPLVTVDGKPRGGVRHRPVLTGPIVPEGQEVVFVLRETAEIRGTVVDPEGSPLRHKYLLVDLPEAGAGCLRVPTDAEGRFLIRMDVGVPVDIRVPDIQMPLSDGRVVRCRGTFRGIVAPVADLVLRIRGVKFDRELTVHVFDAGGRPVPSVLVSVSTGRGRHDLRTGEDGRARFSMLPDFEVRVIAYVPRDGAMPVDTMPPAPLRVVPDGGEVQLQFRIGVLLQGLVLDPGGKSVPGAFVHLIPLREDGTASVSCRTDASGRFRIAALPGVEHLLSATASAADSSGLYAELRGVRPDDGEVEVRLLPE